MPLTTLCPAKLNLGLRVLRRRADGYHDLDTVFVQVVLADRLTFHPSDQRASLETLGSSMDCPPARNLVLRAVSAYAQEFGRPVGGHWVLEKRIPLAAGLGGGSSDAAAALRILQRWCDGPLRADALHRIAAAIGADVPFFLAGGLARGEGRGEILRPLAWPGDFWVVLVTQKQGLSTREVFLGLEGKLTRRPQASTVLDHTGPCALVDGEARVLENDLSGPAFHMMPRLAGILERFRSAGLAAVGLSGSGPTIYGIARDPTLVRRAARHLRGEGWAASVTRFRGQVPRVMGARTVQAWGVVKR